MRAIISKTLIKRARRIHNEKLSKYKEFVSDDKYHPHPVLSGDVYILGSRDGVFRGMIKLKKSGGTQCISASKIEPNDLLKGYNTLVKRNLIPDGIMLIEGVDGQSRDRGYIKKYIHQRILEDMQNIVCVMVNKENIGAVYANSIDQYRNFIVKEIPLEVV